MCPAKPESKARILAVLKDLDLIKLEAWTR
jgi:hypothetical protein